VAVISERKCGYSLYHTCSLSEELDLVQETGGDPCALKCTLILTSDIAMLKGGMDIFKKLVAHARSGPNSAILKSKMAAIQKLICAKND